MLNRRPFSFVAGCTFGAALIVGACGGSDAPTPGGDAQNLFPAADASIEGSTHTTPSDGGSSGSTPDAGDGGTVIDPNYPFDVLYESVEAGGKTQSYIVLVPQHPTAAILPIVFGYHGDGGGADDSKNDFLVEQTTGQSAIIVYPSCPANPSWNLYGGSHQRVACGVRRDPRSGREHARRRSRQRERVRGEQRRLLLRACSAATDPRRSSRSGSWRAARPRFPTPKDPATGSWTNADAWVKCPNEASTAAFIAHDPNDPVVPYSGGVWANQYWLYVNRCSEGTCIDNTSNQADAFGGACKSMTDAPADAPVVFCSGQRRGPRAVVAVRAQLLGVLERAVGRVRSPTSARASTARRARNRTPERR